MSLIYKEKRKVPKAFIGLAISAATAIASGIAKGVAGKKQKEAGEAAQKDAGMAAQASQKKAAAQNSAAATQSQLSQAGQGFDNTQQATPGVGGVPSNIAGAMAGGTNNSTVARAPQVSGQTADTTTEIKNEGAMAGASQALTGAGKAGLGMAQEGVFGQGAQNFANNLSGAGKAAGDAAGGVGS